MHMRSLFDYPEPPSVAVDTSEDAGQSVREVVPSLRRLVYETIAGAGGLTCDELEARLDLKHQTCAARCWELEGQGLVTKSDEKRPTRSGRNARVYQVTGKNPEHIGPIVGRVMNEIREGR